MKRSKWSKKEIVGIATGNPVFWGSAAFTLLTGLSAGIFLELFMKPAQKESVAEYLLHFLTAENADMTYPNPFLSSLILNLALLLLFLLAGLSVYGFPLVFLALLGKGMTLGFSTCLILEELSSRGILAILLRVIPQNLFILPALILAAGAAVHFAALKISHRHSRAERRKRTPRQECSAKAYCLFFLLPALLIAAGCFIEGALFSALR